MKTILILALVVSTSVSALADSSQFLPKRVVPPAAVAKSDHMPKLYPAYSRANPRRENAQPAQPAQASAAMSSPYRPFSRDYRA